VGKHSVSPVGGERGIQGAVIRENGVNRIGDWEEVQRREAADSLSMATRGKVNQLGKGMEGSKATAKRKDARIKREYYLEKYLEMFKSGWGAAEENQ